MSDPTAPKVRPSAVVVNDDPTQLVVLAGLTRRAGLEPIPFQSAEAALDAMRRSGPPALVISDLYMPGLDGWRFCRLLRSPEYAALNSVPILVVSATFAGDEPETIATDVGADAFLASPIDGAAFRGRVHSLMRGETTRVPRRVLIVEDSRTLAALLARAFGDAGYAAEAAGSLHEARAALERAPCSIAVLDYHLPDGTGDALLETLRVQQPGCICVMITSDPSPDLAMDWMKRGAAAYLRKPFQPAYLLDLCAKASRERTLLRTADLLEIRTRELRQSEERYRLIAENTSDSIWMMDASLRFTYLSPSTERLFGYSCEEWETLGWDTFVHPEDLGAVRLLFAGIQGDRDSASQTLAIRVRRRDGREMWVEFTASPIRAPGGQLSGIVGVTRDITQRRQDQDALRDSLQMSDDIIQAIPAGFFIYQFEPPDRLVLVSANPEAERLTGITAAQCAGKEFDEIWPEARKMGITERYLDVVRTGRMFAAEDVVYADQRMSGAFRIHAFLLPRDRLAISFENITARKHAEAERERLQAQLTQAQKMESIGRLAGGVAHDFNNMLGVILGHAEMAMGSIATDHPLYPDLQAILRAGKRSSELTRQLLAFARKQTASPRPLDLNDVVANMLQMMQRLIGEDIRLVWEPCDGLWPVLMDPSQVDQILANLCVNARDAINGVGRVVIKTANVPVGQLCCSFHPESISCEYVAISVMDDGCGMDKETLSRLFEPFFTTKEAGKGTGLGLATVYGIVRQNRGHICVESEPGKGSLFRICLPRSVSQPDPAGQERPSPSDGRHETVLTVEDDPAILSMTARMLERIGYRVLTAGSPLEAIRIAKEQGGAIDLLMTDVVMPEMNGRELAERLTPLCPGLKVLYASGYTADVIARHGAPGQDAVLVEKPYSTQTLAEKVEQALGRG